MNLLEKFKNKKIKKRFFRVFRPFFVSHKLNNRSNLVWMIGSGRSGSTWISSILNYNLKYRELFEPLHPKWIDEFGEKKTHHYFNEKMPNHLSNKFISKLKGKGYTFEIDYTNDRFFYKGILTKDIYSNLYAYQIKKRAPSLKIILLIRNPFDVALSKQERKSWGWADNPGEFLNQHQLMQDFLNPFRQIIEEVIAKEDYIVNLILTWAIIYYVPLKQFKKKDLLIVFYEKVYLNPVDEINRIQQYIGKTNKNHKIPKEVIRKKSHVTINSSDNLKSKTLKNIWKEKLTIEQIDLSYKVLKAFGFDKLYDENKYPDSASINQFFKK